MGLRYNGRVNRAHVILPLALGLLAGCAASKPPPPGWQQGGAPLYVPRAMWTIPPATYYQGYVNVEITQDGRVLENGDAKFGIDTAGRVFDLDGHAVALLRPDGRLIGAGNEDLGFVGPTTAALPGTAYASLAITQAGQVLRYTEDGQMTQLGNWAGCGMFVPSLQACMLVTYLAATKYQPTRPSLYPYSPYGSPYGYGSMAPGMGFGIP